MNRTPLDNAASPRHVLAGTSWLSIALLAAVLGLTGCQEKGAFEQAGEEVDEAADTLKNGQESTANKLDDAVDDLREGVNDAKDELSK